MFKKYVYYVLEEKRLVITSNIIENDNYIRLLETNGNDITILLNTCNMFCAGYYLACRHNTIKITNIIDEFTSV